MAGHTPWNKIKHKGLNPNHLNPKIKSCCEWCLENKKDGTWSLGSLTGKRLDVCCCYAVDNRGEIDPLIPTEV